MKHLTDEQLSAVLDDALSGPERAACEAHLAECDACRSRLADADALDVSLEQSLAHDPGEAYFETFADRVAARIAAEGASARPRAAAVPEPRSFWGWLLSPRGLTLAGSTAALLLVAGLAWVRFQDRGGSAADLREPTPSPVGEALREQAAPEAVTPPTAPTEDVVRSQPAPDAGAAPMSARSNAVAPEASRARELRPDERGEMVRVQTSTPPAAARDAGTTTTLGQMKQRSLAPATGGTSPPPVAPAAPQAIAPPSPAAEGKRAASDVAPTAKASTAPSEAAMRQPLTRSEESEQLRTTSDALAPCGTVRDSRGRAVAGAQVMVVNDVTRTSRTGPDGSFCLKRLERGDELSVLRVGYEPVRITVGDVAPLAVVMEPVGTLGPDAKQGLTPSPSRDGQAFGLAPEATKALGSAKSKPTAPAPDVYAKQPAQVRESVAAAREASRVARRDRAASAMDAAAEKWDAIAAMVTGSPLHDARFQALSLRRESLSAEPTPERLKRFEDGLNVFLAQTPRDLPEYSTSQRWKSQLSPTNKSLYR